MRLQLNLSKTEKIIAVILLAVIAIGSWLDYQYFIELRKNLSEAGSYEACYTYEEIIRNKAIIKHWMNGFLSQTYPSLYKYLNKTKYITLTPLWTIAYASKNLVIIIEIEYPVENSPSRYMIYVKGNSSQLLNELFGPNFTAVINYMNKLNKTLTDIINKSHGSIKVETRGGPSIDVMNLTYEKMYIGSYHISSLEINGKPLLGYLENYVPHEEECSLKDRLSWERVPKGFPILLNKYRLLGYAFFFTAKVFIDPFKNTTHWFLLIRDNLSQLIYALKNINETLAGPGICPDTNYTVKLFKQIVFKTVNKSIQSYNVTIGYAVYNSTIIPIIYVTDEVIGPHYELVVNCCDGAYYFQRIKDYWAYNDVVKGRTSINDTESCRGGWVKVRRGI